MLFTSDNVGHGAITTQEPWRGAKGMFYEGGIRVLFLARWPDRIKAGSTCGVPVTGLDVYPTLLEVCGAGPGRFILFGENSLRHVLKEYLAHYHGERCHQGLGNVIPFLQPHAANNRERPIQCHERLGGTLKFYYRKVA